MAHRVIGLPDGTLSAGPHWSTIARLCRHQLQPSCLLPLQQGKQAQAGDDQQQRDNRPSGRADAAACSLLVAFPQVVELATEHGR
jgi:hypothetical protein